MKIFECFFISAFLMTFQVVELSIAFNQFIIYF